MRADLLHQHVARQAVGGDAEMQHAARQRPRLVHLHLVAQPREVVGGRQPARPGADDQHALAAGLAGDGQAPAFGGGAVAKGRASTLWMPTALSSSARLQLVSHG